MTRATKVHDVIVIGGGFAGLIASRELRHRGRSVILVEARDRLGGRTWWKPNALAGLGLEMGGTWVDPRQRFSWAETQRYHMPVGEPVSGAPPNVWLVGGHRREGVFPVAVEELGDLERVVRALGHAAERIDPARPLYTQPVADLDISLDEFLERLQVRATVREAAAVYLSAYSSASSSDVSALHLLRRIAAAGSFAEFVLSGASHPLTGGTASLIQAIVADTRAEMIFNAPVSRVEQDRSGVTVWANGRELRARAVVVCIPANVLQDVEFEPPLSEAKLALSKEGLACTGTKVWAIATGVPAGFSGCGRGAGLDMVWADRLLGHDLTLVVGYGPDSDMLDIHDEAAVGRALQAFVPSAEVRECAGHDWRHDPYSKETWAVFRPGQITRYEQALRNPEGRIIFGGSHTARRWPGFIDGAIESGFSAATQADRILSTH
jgi:monoamine oxidase